MSGRYDIVDSCFPVRLINYLNLCALFLGKPRVYTLPMERPLQDGVRVFRKCDDEEACGFTERWTIYEKALDELFEMGRELNTIEWDLGYTNFRKFILDIVQFLRQYKPEIFLRGGDLGGLKLL